MIRNESGTMSKYRKRFINKAEIPKRVGSREINGVEER